jgi:hypothetical protein
MASRKRDFKKAKKEIPLPPAIQVSTVSAEKDTSKPKAEKPKATRTRTTPRNSAKPVEVTELVTEGLPDDWKNPELPHAGTFAALASISF